MAILNPMAAGRLSLKDEACFRGSPTRTLLGGPLVLYRLAGSMTADRRTARNAERGAWWFDSTMFDALVDDVLEATYDGNRQSRRNILAGTRTDFAVKQSWSNMAWFCRLVLKPGQESWAWVGPAEQQQDVGKGFFDGMMPGGGTQYFLAGLDRIPDIGATKQSTHSAISELMRSPGWRG